MTFAGRIGQRFAGPLVRRLAQSLVWLGPARAAAALLLGIAGMLMLLMVVVVVQAARFDVSATQPANLGHWGQTAVPLRAPLPLSDGPGLWLLRGDVSLHNARVKEQPRPAAESFEGPFAVPLHSIERVVISGGRIWLNAGREPRGTASAPENAVIYHLLEPLQRFAFDTLILQGAHVTTQRVGGGQQTIERLDAEIRASPGRGATSASGRFHYRGEPVDFEASLQPVVTRRGRWSLPARLTASNRHLSATFDGLIQFESGLRLNGRLELRAPSLSAVLHWLGSPLPETIMAGAFSARGAAAWRDGVLAFERVDAELDGQAAQGALTISVAGPRPFVDGALAFDRLDARAVLRWSGLAPPEAVSDVRTVPTWGSLPARLPLFDAVDADLRMSATTTSGLNVPSGRVAASLTAKAGVVVADIAEIEFANGAGAGQMTIDQRDPAPSYRLRGFVNNTEAAAVLAMAHMPAFVTGPANLRFEFTGRGRSLVESARASIGEISLSMPAKGRMQLDIAGLLADVRDRKSFALATHQNRQSEFEHLVARLAVRRGTIMSEHVSISRDGLTVTADGTLQALTGGLYVRLLTDHGQGLARTARLGRSQSVLIHGEAANPTVLLEESTGLPIPASISVPQVVPRPPPQPR